MSQLFIETTSVRKKENLSDWLDRYFTEPVAMLFSKIFLKMQLSPNIVTLFSMITGVCGGLLFMARTIPLQLLGIGLVILSAIFDASDGQVARLGTKRSRFGRFFDGVADGTVYAAIYIGVTVHLMTDCIPFTDIPWGVSILPLVLIGALLHSDQARMADYYKNLHMFFLDSTRGHELSKSEDVLAECKEQRRLTLDKIRLLSYYSYTKMQEKRTPYVQKLLRLVDNNDTDEAKKAIEEFSLVSHTVVRWKNFLTFNVRTYTLFAFILLNQYVFLFPFVIFVIEPVKIFLVRKYERCAKALLSKYFPQA